MEHQELIQTRALSDMSEGVLAIRFDGVVELANDAALHILVRRREDLVGKPFAMSFFADEENDAFAQCVLDAIYDKTQGHERYVPYSAEGQVKQLRVVSSFLREDGEAVGVVLVLSDITELTEMRDAVKAMERIRGLNQQLEIRNRLLQETFGRYLSDDIVKEILEAPDGLKLGGQKHELTILMSDLRGFTLLSRHMEPQDLIAMLNHYFSEMYEAISRYHGTVIEFLGDGMLVIFGAPVSSARHAADAVAAAVEMQQRMAGVNAWNAARGYPELAMGIGINTDEVVLGNIGSERRTKYGVIGAAVNLTGRIESYTTEGQIILSPTTRARIAEPLTVAQEISAAPKGLDGPVTLTVVSGIGGDYALQLQSDDVPPRPLSAPAEVAFRVLDGKHLDGGALQGVLTALSPRQAVLQTDAPLQPFDNLCLSVCDGLYAKVAACTPDGACLRFTGKPEGFDDWLASLS